jgi:hypothetical protein
VTTPRLLLAFLCAAAPALAHAQPVAPPPPSGQPPAPATQTAPPGTITGEAPIVAGNAASAKQRALDDAFRQAVERSFTVLAAEVGLATPGLAQLRASLFGRAKRYLRSYRIVDQGEEGGRYRVHVDADVDEGLLRRDIERARGASGTAVPVRAATGAAVLVAGTPPEAVTALARALGAAGLRADTPPLGAVDEGRARDVAARTGAAGAALVSASATAEGAVRGTGKVAASCRLAVRVLPSSGSQPADRGTETRAFADGDEAARTECLARAAGELAPAVAAALSGGGTAAPGMHLVTLDVDLVEPAALPLLLQALRKAGNGAEVRRVTVGHVELRATTRMSPPALVASLARELGGTATVTPGAALADRMALQVRLSATELAPNP